MIFSACGVPLRPLDAGVDVFGVLAEDDDVHPLGMRDGRRRAGEVAHRPHARIEIEHLAQRDVEAADAAADRRGQRTLDRDLVGADGLERVVRQPLAVLFLGLLAGRHLEPDDPLACRRKAFATAASNTRTLARQMSGPVPSPSMNGTIGSSGTMRRPSCVVIAVPSVGGFENRKVGIVSAFLGHITSTALPDLHRNCGKRCGNHRRSRTRRINAAPTAFCTRLVRQRRESRSRTRTRRLYLRAVKSGSTGRSSIITIHSCTSSSPIRCPPPRSKSFEAIPGVTVDARSRTPGRRISRATSPTLTR